MPHTILLVSYDAVLGSTRSTLLERVGASVKCVGRLPDFKRWLDSTADFVVICTSVPDDDARVIVAETHASRPGTQVVGLQSLEHAKRPYVDISIPGSPQVLQDKFRKLLNGAARSNGA